jgi:putative ABC transport system permease protein
MMRIITRGLLAHRRRLAATALAVILGVSLIAGTLVLTDTISQTFGGLYGTVYKGTAAVVRAKAAFTGIQGSGAQRPLVDAGLVGSLRTVRGVAADEGIIFGYTRLVGKNGQALGHPAAGAPTLGGNWEQVAALNPFHLVAGHAPQAPGQVAIDAKSARDGHLAVGDTTTVLANGPPQRVRVVGIVGFGAADSPGGASVVLFTAPVAQRLVTAPGKFTSISFVAQPGVSQAQLVHNLRAVLPAGLEAVTGQQAASEDRSAIMNALGSFNTLLIVFAIAALLVGAFMIFNTFSITVAQRTRENGLLRAVGATRRQILSAVLLEAAVVGLLASAAGLALGVAVATGLKALLGALGIGIPAGGIVFAVRTVIVALLVGTGVTVVAALSPARKAGKVAPIAAMHEAVVTSTGYGSKQRVFVGIGVLTAGVAALFAGLLAHGPSPVLLVGLGAALVFFGVAILGRTVSLPLSRVLGAPLPAVRGIAGTIARENAMRNPKRTAATASALMICVGLVSFITIFASSTRAAINTVVNRSFAGDFVIDSGAGMGGGFDPSLARRVGQLPQVALASGARVGMAKIEGSVQQVVAVDPKTAFGIFDVQPLQGNQNNLGRNAIAVYKTEATDHHLKIGDYIPVRFADTGTRLMRVALIYGSNEPAGNYLLGISAYQANFTSQYDQQVFVKKAPGVSSAAALAAIETVTRHYPGATVLNEAQYKAQAAQPINQLLGLIYVLLALAVIIALLGIGNTLALSIFERIREIGLLRAVGMTRRQLRSAIRLESVVIALQGTVLGLLIGLCFGWAITHALNLLGTGVVSIPYRTLVIIVILAALGGVLAAARPARRAAKLNIMRAIVSE